MNWDAPLARPLKPRDYGELVTLADARTYVFKLPPTMAGWQAWVRAIELLLAAAANPTKAAIEAATEQLELAMFHTARTDMPSDEALKRKKGPPPA